MTANVKLIAARTKSPSVRSATRPTFYEFFAGGGMVRAGLGDEWKCAFANDIDEKKCASYRTNWGKHELVEADIAKISVDDLPEEPADLAWASFPCQDLSLAGQGAGLNGSRSSAFWPFMRLMKQLRDNDRAPRIVTLENVCGTLTSNGGRDFQEIVSAFAKLDYEVGAVVLDAKLFVPQSRPRLFIVATDRSLSPDLRRAAPGSLGSHPSLTRAVANLPADLKKSWIWWKLDDVPPRPTALIDLVERDPRDVEWQNEAETRKVLALMSSLHRGKVQTASRQKAPQAGTLYRRMRKAADGCTYQRAEIRFDGIAGCLRTPKGGSSRQMIMLVEGRRIRSRLLSARETARLMGLPESYVLPTSYTEAYHLTGDGVVSPVVKHLSDSIFLPLLKQRARRVAS